MKHLLNRIFKVIWSKVQLAWVAVSEATAAHGKQQSITRITRTVTTVAMLSGGAAIAAPPAPNQLPTGGQVAAGVAAIGTSGNTMTVTQSSNRAAINWNTFDIGSQAQVNFVQPSANAVALNRVTSGNPSQIFGQLSSNGQIYLINAAGVYFAPGAQVNVGGIVATTMSMSDAAFMAGSTTFNRNGSTGKVVNEGTITTSLNGYIAMLAPEVRNSGLLLAQSGTVAMAAGESITLNFGPTSKLESITVSAAQLDTLVENRAAIKAPNGLVILSARAANQLAASVVNSGTIEAKGVSQQGGRIILEGATVASTGTLDVSSDTAQAGTIQINGKNVSISGNVIATTPAANTQDGSIKVSATQSLNISNANINVSASQGGQIQLSAHQIQLTDTTINADGDLQGGTVQISATSIQQDNPFHDPFNIPTLPATLAATGFTSISSRGRRGQGGNAILTGDSITLDGDTHINVSGAFGGGNALIGGDWQGSNGVYQATTTYMGQDVTIDVSATDQGDGGKVVLWSDVSNANGWTKAYGSVYAKGGLNGGNGGQIETSGHSVDTAGVAINAGADKGAGGLWLIDPYNYAIGSSEAATIVGSLNNGTSVTIDTAYNPTGSPSGASGSVNSVASVGAAGDIWVTSVIEKTSGGDATLTLKANRMVVLQANVSSTSGRLNLVLWSDYDHTLDGGVAIGTSSSPITINTNGGNFWAGGSSTANGSTTWLGLTVGNGPSVGATGANSNGLDLNADINTAGGYVLIWAGPSSADPAAYGIGLYGNHSISAGSGDITLLANQIYNWSGNGILVASTTGDLNLAPANGAWSGGFDFNGTTSGTAFILNNIGGTGQPLAIHGFSSLGGLFVGYYDHMAGLVQGNTGNVTISSPIDISGPIGLFGNDITLNAGLTARHLTESAIILEAVGDITQNSSGSLTASEILLVAAIARLANTTNNVDMLTAPSIGDITYVNAGGLTIATSVFTTAGIAATGAVNISVQSGDINVAELVSTTTSASNGIVLNAGAASAAGVATGGNIVISRNGSVSVGSGGRAALYTGSISDSTGLTTLVGSNSANYRYNSNASTTLSPPLGAGVYGIYREAYMPPPTPAPTPTSTTGSDTSSGMMMSTVLSTTPPMVATLPVATMDTESMVSISTTTGLVSTMSSSDAAPLAAATSTTAGVGASGRSLPFEKHVHKSSARSRQHDESQVADMTTASKANGSSQPLGQRQGSDKPATAQDGVAKSAQKAASSTVASRAAARAIARAKDAAIATSGSVVANPQVLTKAILPNYAPVYSLTGEVMPNNNQVNDVRNTSAAKSGGKKDPIHRAIAVDDLTDPNNPMSVMMLIL